MHALEINSYASGESEPITWGAGPHDSGPRVEWESRWRALDSGSLCYDRQIESIDAFPDTPVLDLKS